MKKEGRALKTYSDMATPESDLSSLLGGCRFIEMIERKKLSEEVEVNENKMRSVAPGPLFMSDVPN